MLRMLYHIFSILVVIVSLTNALTLSGIVYNQDNLPKSGVVVSLKNAGLTYTTDTADVWILSNSSNAVKLLSKKNHDAIKWDGKAISLYLSVSSNVRVDVLDARGTAIRNGFLGNLSAGYHRIPIDGSHATLVQWIRLRTSTDEIILSAMTGQAAGLPKILSFSLRQCI